MTSYVGTGLGLMIRKSDHSKETRCLKHGSGNHSSVVPSLIWDVQGHVTPRSTQATRSETPTFAGVSGAWPCFFGGRVSKQNTMENFLSWLDLVYKSESRKSYFGGVVVG